MKRPAARRRRSSASRAGAQVCPELTIRTTFIVGFPGETEAEFEELLDFLDEAQLDRVGCFAYSPVEGATANDLGPTGAGRQSRKSAGALHGSASRRFRRSASSARSASVSTSSSMRSAQRVAKGRSNGDAPEIDGAVYVASRRPLRVGEIVKVKVERADAYDLHGTAVGF